MDTPREFTQEQAWDMYNIVLQCSFLESMTIDGLRLLNRNARKLVNSLEAAHDTERYTPKRHETSKFRYCVWDTETEKALQIEGERFIWTTLPRVKRECARLNASKRYVVQTETADVMSPLSKIVDTETNTELEGVYIDIETANGECSRLNGESS